MVCLGPAARGEAVIASSNIYVAPGNSGQGAAGEVSKGAADSRLDAAGGVESFPTHCGLNATGPVLSASADGGIGNTGSVVATAGDGGDRRINTLIVITCLVVPAPSYGAEPADGPVANGD
jgi:hypothetical protein